MSNFDHAWRERWARVRNTVERHPDKTDAQLVSYIGRKRWSSVPARDIAATRVFLGQIPFPERAPHDDRVRMFWVAAHLSGLWARMEHTVGDRLRCDVLVMAADDSTPLAVIEVKTNTASPADVRQVINYRQCAGAPIAIVTTHNFSSGTWGEAERNGVALLTGAETIGVIRAQMAARAAA